MPSMASMTVKKDDGTTDIVYDALTGAAGDGSPAVWRQDTGVAAGLPVGLRPTLEMMSTNNGPRTARRCVITYRRPYATQDSTTTKYSSSDQVLIRIEVTEPNAIPASEINEAISQCFNLTDHSLINSALKAGYAPA